MQRSGLSHEPRIYWSCIPPVRGYRYGPPGAGIDDLAAVSLFAKRVNRGLHAPDHPFDVDVVDLVDNLRRDGFDGRRRRNPGIIHNHVETTQRGAGFLNRRKHRSRSETSTFTAMALPPLRMISSATARAVSSLKSAIATAKPSFTGAAQSLYQSPPEPVTRATFAFLCPYSESQNLAEMELAHQQRVIAVVNGNGHHGRAIHIHRRTQRRFKGIGAPRQSPRRQRHRHRL